MRVTVRIVVEVPVYYKVEVDPNAEPEDGEWITMTKPDDDPVPELHKECLFGEQFSEIEEQVQDKLASMGYRQMWVRDTSADTEPLEPELGLESDLE